MKTIKRPDNDLLLLILFIGMFLAAGFYLFATETREQNRSYNKKWTACYLIRPEVKNDLSFAIENYEGEEVEYSYAVTGPVGMDDLGNNLTMRPGEKSVVEIPVKEAGAKVTITYADRSVSLSNP